MFSSQNASEAECHRERQLPLRERSPSAWCRSPGRRSRSGCRTSRRPPARAAAPARSRRGCRTRRAPAPGTGCRSASRRARSSTIGTQHDQVAEQDGEDRLPPVHAAADQARRQHVGGDADREADPERGDVVGRPGPLRDRRRRQVGVRQCRIGRIDSQFVQLAGGPAHAGVDGRTGLGLRHGGGLGCSGDPTAVGRTTVRTTMTFQTSGGPATRLTNSPRPRAP